MNPISPIKPPAHRHSTTYEPNYYNQLNESAYNSSNPVTPIEKIPRQFTFESVENLTFKSSNGYDIDKLTDLSPFAKVVDEMISSQNGLTFIPSSEFPSEFTFTSYEAVNWCIRRIDKINDVKSSVIYLQKMMNLKFIYHATECTSHKFIYGFVFYCLNVSNKYSGLSDTRNSIGNANSSSGSLTNLVMDEPEKAFKFRKHNIEWVEVYLSSIDIDGKPEREWISERVEKSFTSFHLTGESNRPIESCQNVIFLLKSIPNRYITNSLTRKNVQDLIGHSHDPGMLFEKNDILYKKVILDIDNDRSDRVEWGVFQYQANYHPTMAFELMFQWLVATGGKLAEKISQWSRKTSILQLVPVPCDPFALPSSINSDPLRGSIFVPLDISCLINNADYLNSSSHSIGETIDLIFDEFPDIERLYRLLLLQEAILKRFGFIRESCVNYSSRENVLKNQIEKNKQKIDGKPDILDGFQNIGGISSNWSYVHYSGGMFAMIPTYSKYKDIVDIMCPPIKVDDIEPTISSSPTRTLYAEDDSEEWQTSNIGFLWSWNKMLTRKWTTSGMIVDEQFQDRMLADFREFCSNADDRLNQFYLDAKNIATKYFCDIPDQNNAIDNTQLFK